MGNVAKGAAAGAAVGSVIPVAGTAVGAVVGALAGAISDWLHHKGENTKAQELRKKRVAALTLQFNQGEDQRQAHVNTAESLLGGIGQADAYGGRVNPNQALDPTLAASLKTRRATPDYSQVVPDETKGSGYEYLSGLTGDLSSAALSMYGGGGANDAQGLTQGGLSGTAVPYGASGGGAISFEDLMKQINSGRAAGSF